MKSIDNQKNRSLRWGLGMLLSIALILGAIPAGNAMFFGSGDIAGQTGGFSSWGAAKAKRISVKFDANKGKAAYDNVGVVVGKAWGASLPKATRSGCTFAGWYTKKSGGKKVTAKTKVKAHIKILYAHWKKKGGFRYVTRKGRTFSAIEKLEGQLIPNGRYMMAFYKGKKTGIIYSFDGYPFNKDGSANKNFVQKKSDKCEGMEGKVSIFSGKKGRYTYKAFAKALGVTWGGKMSHVEGMLPFFIDRGVKVGILPEKEGFIGPDDMVYIGLTGC